jgi:hypothetical protein
MWDICHITKPRAERLTTSFDTLPVRRRFDTGTNGDRGKRVNDFERSMRAWYRADTAAREAEEKVISGYMAYVGGTAPLPFLTWETEATVLRAEATRLIEYVYSAAKQVRKPGIEDFHKTMPSSVGGEIPAAPKVRTKP